MSKLNLLLVSLLFMTFPAFGYDCEQINSYKNLDDAIKVLGAPSVTTPYKNMIYFWKFDDGSKLSVNMIEGVQGEPLKVLVEKEGVTIDCNANPVAACQHVEKIQTSQAQSLDELNTLVGINYSMSTQIDYARYQWSHDNATITMESIPSLEVDGKGDILINKQCQAR